MAGAGKKTFTSGEVLTASDVNTYLMEQSVMYFGGTAARSSAIPTPSTGMTSYIGVTGTATIPQIETYTGSAWQTPYGMTLLSASTFTSYAAVSFNNVFTTTYDAYKIIVTSIDNGNNGSLISYRFRTGGTDDSGSNYQQVTLGLNGAGSAANIAETTTRCKINNFAADFGSAEILVTGPNITANDKVVLFTSFGYDGNNLIRTGGLRYLGTSSMDGFTLFNEGATGTMSARVAVYGFRRS